MIPKIIHQVYISNRDIVSKDQWNPIWRDCYDSWKKQFPEDEYEYHFWDDAKSEIFIREHYPKYYNWYITIPFKIMKADIIRLFALHYYGGIYADLDMYCYKNFYHMLDADFKIVEHKWGLAYERIQNSIMASKKDNQFFLDVVEFAFQRSIVEAEAYHSFIPHNEHLYTREVLTSFVMGFAGPSVVQNFFVDYKYNRKNLLDYKLFNNFKYYYGEDLYTRHMGTCVWDPSANKFSNVKEHWRSLCSMDYDNFDYYTDYSKDYEVVREWHKNMRLGYGDDGYCLFDEYLDKQSNVA